MSTRQNARIKVTLRVKGLGRLLARSVNEALAPDNMTAPPWLHVETSVDGEDLVFTIEVTDATRTRIGGLRNTVDELLSFTYALLRSLEAAAKALKEGESGGSR